MLAWCGPTRTNSRKLPNKKPPRTEVRGGQGPGRTRPRQDDGALTAVERGKTTAV